MADSWDLFFSYRRQDLERAQALLNALAKAGVRVWRDENDIPEQGSITSEVRHGIANSKALLAFYSRTYPLSNPCQQEITIAWLAAEQIGPANERIWIINPEGSFEHIPDLLRDQQCSRFTGDSSQLIRIVRAVKDRLYSIDASLLGSGLRDLPAYYGRRPIRARRFTGRASEFWDLHQELTANRRSIITSAYGQDAAQVRGLGGNGKSLLAGEYSIRFGPAYPGGVFWLNAYGHGDTKGPLNPEQREALRQDQIREFAVEYGVRTEGLKPSEIEAALWKAIEKRGERCLWIVDDVPSGLSPNRLGEAWYARWAKASTLITTRSREYGALGSVLDLGVLSTDEAFSLLCSHRQPASSAEQEAAYRVLELLGCHPLAVEVAGSYLAEGFESLESYASSLTNPLEDAAEFGALLKESLPTGHERSISTTLLKSIWQLGPEGLDFLRLASVLAVAPIQATFVSEVFEIADADDAAKGCLVKAVNQAETLSLCERFGQGARTVHTLVSRTMRFRYPGEERTATLRSAAIQALTKRLASISHIGEHSKVATDMPHARHLVTDNLRTQQETTLAHWVAYRDYERADYASARKLQEQVLAARRRLLGDEHLETLTAMNNLALTLCAESDFTRARELQQQVVTASRALLGEECPDTLTAINNLALTVHAQGDLAAARKLQEQVLGIRRRVLGEEDADTLTAMLNLAQTLHGQGDRPGARELQEQVVAVRRRVLGDEHPDTLTAMHNLAVTLCEQDDPAAAQELQEHVLAVSRRLVGEEHPKTLRTMNNLALTFYAQSDLTQAQKLQEHVLVLRRRVLGEEHADTPAAMHNLGSTLYSQGDLAGARDLQEQALGASRRLLGEEHSETLKTMHSLGMTLYSQGDLAGAQKLQEQVLEARRRQLGEEHPDTLKAMNNLAQTLKTQGDLAQARTIEQQLLEADRRLLGEEHPDTLRVMNNFAQTLKAAGDLAGARKLEEQALAASRRLPGEEQSETLKSKHSLGVTLYAQGDLAGARKLMEEALAGYRRVLSDQHPDTLTTMNNLAVTLYAQGDLAAARKLQEQVLEARRRLLGEGHPETLTAMNNLARMTAKKGAVGPTT